MRAWALLTALMLFLGPVPAQARWATSWAAAPEIWRPRVSDPELVPLEVDNVTLAQELRLSEGGEQLRLRFSNRHGRTPLVIGAARVVHLDGHGRRAQEAAVAFGGAPGLVIPPGAEGFSDPVVLALPDLARLRVEFTLPQATGPCTCHFMGLDPLLVSPPGDHLGADFEPVATSDLRAFLMGVDTYSPGTRGTIAVIGDSITDGSGIAIGSHARWPDVLAERLSAAGLDYGVANMAISGNRLLADGWGSAALGRLDEDVFALPSVTHLFVFIGVNDLGFARPDIMASPRLQEFDKAPVSAELLTAGFRQLIAQAHAHDIKVVGAPIGPFKGAFYWSEEGERIREEVNAWILGSGEFDHVVRFDEVLRDPQDAARIKPGWATDALHPLPPALRAMGESVDLSIFAD
ncbi:SGNH/GDSL hydrolase family protein [Sphingomicrobium nitratireducens]|uniref:SGNH/GDSL hydrolase family protein n=1 Tax=Sphingomicrobium nitratireducens TaxID=2964666 RepID=UPI00223F2C67|nr:SGNH/GDSL hydrolase family protein [Sphingomicrobium nitratireducens]